MGCGDIGRAGQVGDGARNFEIRLTSAADFAESLKDTGERFGVCPADSSADALRR